MPLINCKVELKLKRSKSCVLASNDTENPDANSNSIDNITIKDKRKYMSMYRHLISKRQSKLTKLLSKGFKRSVYWKEYKTKSENNNATSEYGYFLETKLLGVADCLH